ncbi:MAG: hydroxymethylbilane synthase [Acidobacteriota bacterium]
MVDPQRRVLRIGTRGSALALWQARHVADLIAAPTELKIITTSGDRFIDASPTGRLEEGFFTKEIEDKLLAGEIDLAVHSLKDLPTRLSDGLALGAVSARAAVSDMLLVHPEWVDGAARLPVRAGGRVGASSLRRQSMVRTFGEGLEPAQLRGNVPTRVEKCRRGEYAAVIVASAGIKRLDLDLSGLATFELLPQVWIPAPGQAVLGVEIREDDQEARGAVAAVDHAESRQCARIERELLHRFEGGCHEAFGAWASREGPRLVVRLGHEDSLGRWRSVVVAGEDEARLTEAAFAELRREMSSEPRRSEAEAICRRLF